jgi:hypothetical protein
MTTTNNLENQLANNSFILKEKGLEKLEDTNKELHGLGLNVKFE